MKPTLFVASSSESLELAHALQENLEHVAEVTVWDQGVFAPSKYTLESLIEILERADFGVFLFSPDDVVRIREGEKAVVRDNVLFELGLFIGRLSRERNFIVVPRSDAHTLHIPTDLMGLTPIPFDSGRQDGNMRAALGPASTKISKIVSKLGSLRPVSPAITPEVQSPQAGEYSESDKLAIIQSWMGSRPADLNSQVIHFSRVDAELKLPAGTAKALIKQAAARWDYVPEQEGDQTILFRETDQAFTVMPRANFRDW